MAVSPDPGIRSFLSSSRNPERNSPELGRDPADEEVIVYIWLSVISTGKLYRIWLLFEPHVNFIKPFFCEVHIGFSVPIF